jgi:NAD(P)-dependent dehydrogenase (short-subunit alcohol dehydrogenase family)
MTHNNEVALITGASRGLGLAIAREYARRGLKLVLNARGSGDLENVAAELSGTTEVVALAGDVADQQHVEQVVRTAEARFGRVDVLINNASELGPSPMPSLDRLPLDAFERILQVNTVAPLRLIQAVLPGMRQRGSGLIINVTSDAAVQPYATWGGYGASKAALEHLSRILAAELEGSGVRVLVVDPGDMNTAMHQAAEPGVDLSNLPDPEQVAPAFVRLLDRQPAFERIEAQKTLAEAGR